MSNGMRSEIVSIAEIVSSMVSLLKARIPENVEPHHSPAARPASSRSRQAARNLRIKILQRALGTSGDPNCELTISGAGRVAQDYSMKP
jgi:hypothetical protein